MFKKNLIHEVGWASLLAVITLFATLLLAACGDSTATVPTSSTSAVSATNTQAQSTTAAQLAPAEITYSYPAFSPIPKDLPAVESALNVILKQKINATIKLNAIDGANYDQKMKLALAAGEKMDIIFTAPWINNYYQLVANGALLPLDDLFSKSGPKLYASMSPSIWNAARVNGKIYGVINQQQFVKTWGVNVRKDLADKYKLDLSKINKYEDLEPFLSQIKQGEPGITPVYSDDGATAGYIVRPEYLGYDPIIDPVVSVRNDDASVKAVNYFETPEVKQSVELMRKWHQAGYYAKDLIPAADGLAAFKAGKYAVLISQNGPTSESDFKTTYGYDFVGKSFTKNVLTTAGTVATLNAISRTSPNPDRAMMFLELLNTDKEVYNLLSNGIENKNWVWVDKASQLIGTPPGITAENNPYNPNTPWMFGSVFNAYYKDKAQVGKYDLISQLNKNATPSTALGFSFNPEKVKSEVAQVNAAIKQYGEPLLFGLIDPTSGFSELNSKLKQAGLDKVLDEVQRQIDDWKKTK